MNSILEEDIRSFNLPDDLKQIIRGSHIIVTGATGLIGSAVVRCLHALDLNIEYIIPVRNLNKTLTLPQGNNIRYIESELADFFRNTDIKADYVIHCAAPTNGDYMSEHPVETYLFLIESTKSALDYCRNADCKGMVYLSSIECNGILTDDKAADEKRIGFIDRHSVRSSYPLGKLSAEYLCYCYAGEYKVPAKVARLTQTFGAGISKDDKRVFAQFARSALQGRDIVLHTSGSSAKPYCYITDAVSAIIFILLRGVAGEVYNVATPGSYVTILELAHLFRKKVNPNIQVVTQLLENNNYAPETTVNLNPQKLLSLGWKPEYNLEEMIVRLANYLTNSD